jgi:hypothetical protein
MTKAEKKQYVIQLYNQEKDFKQIAQLAHMSLRDITAIIKEYQDKIERQNGTMDDWDIKSKSITTQAIEMFSEDKTPIDVVKELDLDPDEVQEIYLDYLRLQDMHELVTVFNEMQNFLPSFLELFRLTVSRGWNRDDIIDLLWNINTGQLENLKRKIQSLSNTLNWLLRDIKKKESHLRSLDNRLGLIPMTNTANDLTYMPNNMYPPLPDGVTFRIRIPKDEAS